VCFKRFQGRPDVFPGEYPVPLIFAFLTRRGCATCTPFIPLLIGSPCGFAAGHPHAGERQEIVTRNRVGFCDILS
jgi:hypothetical protein